MHDAEDQDELTGFTPEEIKRALENKDQRERERPRRRGAKARDAYAAYIAKGGEVPKSELMLDKNPAFKVDTERQRKIKALEALFKLEKESCVRDIYLMDWWRLMGLDLNCDAIRDYFANKYKSSVSEKDNERQERL